MTEYLKKSFTVRFKSPPPKEKCRKCGIPLGVVIYKLNREPHCKECFTNKPTNKAKGTDNAITENSEKQ